MVKKFINDNWIYIVIIVGFIAISSAYFSPIFQGYSLKQSDIASWKSASKEITDHREMYNEESIWTNTMFSGMPGYSIGIEYPNGLYKVNNLFRLMLPFPIDAVFIAMLCFFILGKSLKIKTEIVIIGAIAYGLVTYNMIIIDAGHNTKMRAIGYLPAVLGAFIMIYRNSKIFFPTVLLALFMGLELMVYHVQMTYYLGFVLVFIGVFEFIKYFKKKELKAYFIRTSLVIVACIFALLANFTSYYYTYAYAKETIRGTPEINVDPSGSIVKAEANQTKGLDRDYIVQWCYGIGETYNLLVPNTKAGDRNTVSDFFDYLKKGSPQQFNYAVEQYQKNQGRIFGFYWGNQPFTPGPNYIGAIMVFLALLYLFFVKSTLKWALLGVSILAIMLSWGKNLGGSIDDMWLTNFFIDYVPLYNKFRTVASILIILNLTVPLMAVLFVQHLYDNKEWAVKNLKKLTISSGAIVGVIVIFTIMPNLFDFTSENEQLIFNNLYQTYSQSPQGVNPTDIETELIDFRIGLFQKDSFRTLILILIAFTLIFLWIKDKVKFKTAISLLVVVVLFDIWTVNKRYLNNEKNPQNKREYLSWEKQTGYENTIAAGPGDKQIYAIEAAENPEIEKITNQRIQEAKKEKRRLSSKDEESIRFSTLNFNTNYRVINLDNAFNSSAVSYFHKSSGGYSAVKLGRYQNMIDFYISKELNYLQEPEKLKVLNMLNTKYYLYQGNLVFQNPLAYGNAWFVDNVKVVENANEEILAIKDIDPKNTAVIDKIFNDQFNGKSFTSDNQSSIELTSYLPNKLTYSSKTASEKLAIFSEIYYKDGWNAYIDGKAVPHLRANFILRGLVIPKGEHTIVFEFKPSMYTIGNIISISAFSIIILSLLFSVYITFIKKENEVLTD
jgi:hypothetical protein